jgi:DNA anti-recombination protein RmuC
LLTLLLLLLITLEIFNIIYINKNIKILSKTNIKIMDRITVLEDENIKLKLQMHNCEKNIQHLFKRLERKCDI